MPQQFAISNAPVLPVNETPIIVATNDDSTSATGSPDQATGKVEGSPVIGGLNGKDRRSRRSRALDEGATHNSEDAVEQALLWLSRHQRKDGSWRFDHHDGACDGSCRNPGNHAATTASTALPLLCFYGAGYSHTEGQYADTINRGLYYLGGRLLLTREGGDLQEGTMYAQGIAAIALCEAAAMTEDPTLRGYGERAIQFILYARIKRGRVALSSGEPGDTTVTGWQLMALKSAQMSGSLSRRQRLRARTAFSTRSRVATARSTVIKICNRAIQRLLWGYSAACILAGSTITRRCAKGFYTWTNKALRKTTSITTTMRPK